VLSGAAGAVLVSFVMTAEALLGARWNVAAVTAAAASLAFALRGLCRALPSPPTSPPSQEGGEKARRTTWTAHGLALLAVVAALLATRAGAATSPDLVFFWGPKAERYALAGTFDIAFMRDPVLRYMNFAYPPLVTNVFALASIAAGRLPWTAAAATFPLVLAALALGLPGLLRSTSGRTKGAAFAALAVAALACAGVENDVAGNGDMPLIFFETLATALLVSPLAAFAPVQWLAGLMLSGAAAAKIEGLPFALAATAAFVLARRREVAGGAARSLVRLLLPVAAALGAWFAFGATREIVVGYSGYGRLLSVHLDRLPAVLEAMAPALAESGRGLPWLVPLTVLLMAGRPTPSSAIPLAAAAALAAFAIFTYLHFGNLEQWVSWSAARLLAPVAPMLVIAGACAVGREAQPRAPRPSPG
jgi:hypothetical protein